MTVINWIVFVSLCSESSNRVLVNFPVSDICYFSSFAFNPACFQAYIEESLSNFDKQDLILEVETSDTTKNVKTKTN